MRRIVVKQNYNITNEEFAELIKEGRSDEVFSILFRGYESLLKKLAQSYTFNESDFNDNFSIVQVGFWKSFLNFDPYNIKGTPFKNYMYAIVKNEFKNHFAILGAEKRKNVVSKTKFLSDSNDDDYSLEETLCDDGIDRRFDNIEQTISLQKFLEHYSNIANIKEVNMFRQYFVLDQTIEQMADDMKTNRNNVASQVYNLKQKMKKFAKNHGYTAAMFS
jgi:RNA polymerase sigma factor (sigma-70 family)